MDGLQKETEEMTLGSMLLTYRPDGTPISKKGLKKLLAAQEKEQRKQEVAARLVRLC